MANFNFELTEDNLNRVESVRGQLNLIAGLLSEASTQQTFNTTDLYNFLAGQRDTLEDVVEATYDHQAQSMGAFWWEVYARALSGVSISMVEAKEVTRRLTFSANEDESLRPVLDAWVAALVVEGDVKRQDPQDAKGGDPAAAPASEPAPVPVPEPLSAPVSKRRSTGRARRGAPLGEPA